MLRKLPPNFQNRWAPESTSLSPFFVFFSLHCRVPTPRKTAGPDVGVATWLEGFQELGAESNHFHSMLLDGLLLPLILMRLRLDKEIKNLACI